MNPVPSPPFPPSYARHQPRVYLFALGAARRTGPGLEDVRVVAQVCVRVAGRTNFARDKTSQRTRPTHTAPSMPKRAVAPAQAAALERTMRRWEARESRGWESAGSRARCSLGLGVSPHKHVQAEDIAEHCSFSPCFYSCGMLLERNTDSVLLVSNETVFTLGRAVGHC